MGHKVDFIGIQETHVADPGNIDIKGCWGSSNFEFELVESQGRSGGLLSIWDPLIFTKHNVIKSKNFLAISGHWKGFSDTISMVNVYGPQSISDKRELWAEILSLKDIIKGSWVIFGDFSAVRKPEERLRSSFCKYSSSDFNKFICEFGLKEFAMGGCKFIYLRDDGSKLSKIDHFLVCNQFIQMQPHSTVTALAKEHSDHSRLFLTHSKANFGTPPFRFYNSWLLSSGFNEVFDNSWSTLRGFGTPDILLKAKIKWVKNATRS